jgi:hypothetical protein
MTEAEYIALAIASIGGDTEDGLLATNMPIFWSLHATSSDAARGIEIKIDGVRFLLGQTWRKVSFKALDGASVNLSDMFDHLLKLLALFQAELAQAQSGADGTAAIGQLTTTAPVMPDSPRGVNPNARSYRGDPLRRRGDNRP